MTSKNEILSDHFERLKELIPEVYTQNFPKEEENEKTKLYAILKRSLRIIEAVYLQDRDMFHSARIEEYGHIIKDLKALGYDYKGNEELLEKATGQLIMAAKKPMEKAKGKTKKDSEDRKAM